jgi:hypothetical protein
MSGNWVRLLWHWTDVEFRHSLTFPFFIGALRSPVGSSDASEAEARQEVESLVNEIAEFQADDVILHIYRCPTLGQLVLSRVAGAAQPPRAIPIHRSNGSQSRVYVSDVAEIAQPAQVSAIAEAIWSESAEAILRGNFSCNGGRFSPFSQYDLNIISRAFT